MRITSRQTRQLVSKGRTKLKRCRTRTRFMTLSHKGKGENWEKLSFLSLLFPGLSVRVLRGRKTLLSFHGAYSHVTHFRLHLSAICPDYSPPSPWLDRDKNNASPQSGPAPSFLPSSSPFTFTLFLHPFVESSNKTRISPCDRR